MSDRYVLNADRTVSRMDDYVEWMKRFGTDARQIARTEMLDGRIVSTEFLAIDFNHSNSGPPMLFETVVFSSEKDLSEEWMEHCSTYAQALEQHARGVKEAERLAAEGVSSSDTPDRT